MINITYITVKYCWQKQSMGYYGNHYWNEWRILRSSSLIYYVMHAAPFDQFDNAIKWQLYIAAAYKDSPK